MTRWFSISLVLAALVASPNQILAKGEHPLHLSTEQTASVYQPGDFLGSCGHGRYRYHARCIGPADELLP
jgi:hypothetical protein